MPVGKIIVGLCGCGNCGNSHMGQNLEIREGYVCLDEEFEGKRFAADTGVLFKGKFDTLVRLLKEGKNCAYTDALLRGKLSKRIELRPEAKAKRMPTFARFGLVSLHHRRGALPLRN